MKITPCKMISAIAMVLISFVFIAGCSAVGERVQPESASKASGESTVAQAEKAVTTPTPAAKRKENAVTPAGVKDSPVAKADKEKSADPTRSPGVRSSIYLGSDGKMAGTGDPSKPVSEAHRIGMRKRPAALAGVGLPKDRFGLIDWVAIVENGDIKPIGSLDPSKAEIPPLEMDVIIEAKGDFVNNVLFPHGTHTYWLGCESCHPAPFVMGKGKNKMSMVEISEGKWCGECHGKIAFPLTDCSRCHTQKRLNQP